MEVLGKMSEQELIDTAARALSSCNWTVGQCASEWCKRYSKGRTDADFGSLVGLSGDQIYSRRRVWETFADVRNNYGNLKWSHFFVALTWEDSAECLAWADEQDATVAEMKAWRRMQHGEDLSEPSSDASEFRNVTEPAGDDEQPTPPARSVETSATMATLGDDSDEQAAYSPFRSGASTATAARSKPDEDNGDGASRDAVLMRRACNQIGNVFPKLDDPEAFIRELISECSRSHRISTLTAVREWLFDNGYEVVKKKEPEHL